MQESTLNWNNRTWPCIHKTFPANKSNFMEIDPLWHDIYWDLPSFSPTTCSVFAWQYTQIVILCMLWFKLQLAGFDKTHPEDNLVYLVPSIKLWDLQSRTVIHWWGKKTYGLFVAEGFPLVTLGQGADKEQVS